MNLIGKVSPLQARLLSRGWVEVWLYPSMTPAIEAGECSVTCPGRALPPGKTRYPLYRSLDGPHGRSGRSENLAPPGFDPRTVQPVAQSLYRLSYPAHFELNWGSSYLQVDPRQRVRFSDWVTDWKISVSNLDRGKGFLPPSQTSRPSLGSLLQYGYQVLSHC